MGNKWCGIFLTILLLAQMSQTIFGQNPNIPADDHHGAVPPELVMSAVVLKDGRIANYYINATVIETEFNNNPCPCVNQTELKAERLKVLKLWSAYTNYDQQYILDSYEQFATPDTLPDGTVNQFLHQFVVNGYATYSANSVAAEYALQANDANIHLFSELDPVSVEWQADNITVIYKIITNYTLPGLPGAPILDGFVNTHYVKFVPCKAEIWIDIMTQDSLVSTYLAAAQSNHPASDICDKIQQACTGPNQVYDSYESCLNYMSVVVNHTSFCPTGSLIANSSGCHYFHASSALNYPEIHCQHVRPYDSPTCQDFCLTQGCGNCDSNAECVFVSGSNSIVPKYQCKCKSGYVGNGTHCSPVTCSAQWQCPSEYNYGSCQNGLCGCNSGNGFKWVPDQATVNSHQACQCSENETVQWYNGVPECMPIGRCRYVWQCPQAATQYTSITCTKYGQNALVPFNTCLCNYGYDNLGFSYKCQCSVPKREIWSNVRQGTLCLAPNECTDNYHCASNNCQVQPGQWLGTCAA
ncbi:putative EGF-like domain-containing protein [Acanthamoeba castellanii mimivirus]|uniref:Putative EGF-like domain-containing protein R659 n=6 Tax=Mimivirus TaxID=315393 RepID=YR659_MIMIV|nr:putative EGF-like domain-containing protein [Acanthamoeba polyphaga mimivirus]Q5UR16.1 RecName: Full=Putative EGF-like domain-containing protein R659; Flags: Precursor [Acanthamoeba polyphaga mimivirus]ALR84247.1 putative EGF-like domain-containing protein [Niemeyer virus]AMZ03102.1 putative EGF-like domain-containing protein [Mimivirus Bombay]BAV61780.1 putative EGF-like domain-containing protein [Acanthamoeba castellanii mimivirus]AAV50920.1 unknown [Acanthamoeba polyphaga mimivirus]ADO1